MTQSPGRTNGNLSGQVALVTGGGRGIGRAGALALAAAGAKVAVVARTVAELEITVNLMQAAGGAALPLPADVTDLPAMQCVVESVHIQLGPIDLLVNNAGMAGPIGPVVAIDANEWWRCVEVNLRGPMHCCRLVLPEMIARGKGRIINVASGAGTAGIPYLSAYVAGKAGVIQFSESMANEERAAGVRVFAIQPGTVRTAMAEETLNSEAGRKWLPWFRSHFDQGRDVPPETAARLIVFLASGRGDALSGRFIDACSDYEKLAEEASRVQQQDLLVMRYRGP